MKHLNALEHLDGYAGIQGAGVHKDMSFMDNKEELQRGLGHREGLTGEAVDESEWREGDVGQATLNRTLISLSTQYEQEQLYFCISNVSH